MATTLEKNLSDYDATKMPPHERVAMQTYAIAVSEWNSEITSALLNGAYSTLIENGVKESNIYIVRVPGSFELVYAATQLQSDYLCEINNRIIPKYSAVITLGCVVKGETPHFDYVCQGVTEGIARLNSSKSGCPVIYGLLTTNSIEQARERAGGKLGNKGIEAAVTAVKMANTVW